MHPLLLKERILIRVKTGCPRTEILDYLPAEELFLVAVKGQPVDGKANAEIERFFSKLLKKEVRIKTGRTAKKKLLVVS